MGVAARILLRDTGTAVVLVCGRVELCRYAYRPAMPTDHAPRPYFHPVRTRRGVLVTDAVPPDHPWHYGLSVAVPSVSGTSFWGGPTYVRDAGYEPLENHGRVVHRRWLARHTARDAAVLRHRLTWLDRTGAPVIDESRTIVARLDGDRSWALDLRTRLRNITSSALAVGSPATEGRAGAGYGGLFLRAAPAFRGGPVLDTDGRHDDDVFGHRAAAVTMTGDRARVTMTADPVAREPWFVRRDEYPGICAALAFAHEMRISPGDNVARGYRLCFADLTD